MKPDILLRNFVASIRGHIPVGANLASVLSDMLCIGKEAIYRRLRGEVPFTFDEVATITEKMSLSLDNIVGLSMSGSSIFYMNKIEYAHPGEEDYFLFHRAIDDLKILAKESRSEVGSASNHFPQAFLLGYDMISKFRTYKWLYQSHTLSADTPFSQFTVTDRMREVQNEFVRQSVNVKYTYYVWDEQIFENMIKDIYYFLDVHMITKEEALKLRDELLRFVDDLEQLAVRGHYDNGNKIDIYISSTHIETTYSYVESESIKFCSLRVFMMNTIASQDPEMFSTIKNWVQSLRRVSTLISVSGELKRVKFFRTQRQLLASMKI